MMSALEGLRVLDLTNLLPGPFAGMILGDYGADVIKIERPGEGDPGRLTAPLVAGISTRHAMVNRNKRSIAIDLKHEAGRALFLDLVRTADVVLEGFRPGVMTRLGIDYPVLAEANPRVIYCSISGFGATGPRRDEPGHDLNYLSLTGTIAMNGGLPATQIADLAGGSLQALIGVLLALAARERTGRGQAIDIAMADGAFFLQVESILHALAGLPARRGETRLTGRYPCYNLYATADGGWLAVGAIERKFWENLCSALDRPDLLERQHDATAIEELRALFRERTRGEWEARLAGRETCCTAVLETTEAVADPNIAARGLLVDVAHPVAGALRQLGFPIKLSDTPGQVRRPAPALGEHSREVLSELGYPADQIEALAQAGVISCEKELRKPC